MNKKYFVYIHRLRQDGRVYIGQSCLKDLKARSGTNGRRYRRCVKFYNAIQKYGWDAFDHIVLFSNLTLEEANALEAALIIKYDSINNGFNIYDGGRNHQYTLEQRKAMSERMKGDKNPNYGKPRPEAVKRKIGQANAISQKGKKHTPETLEKMRKAHQKYQPILCVETGKIYTCLSEASRDMGKGNSHIGEVCRGKRKTAFGYHWRFIEEEEKNARY